MRIIARVLPHFNRFSCPPGHLDHGETGGRCGCAHHWPRRCWKMANIAGLGTGISVICKACGFLANPANLALITLNRRSAGDAYNPTPRALLSQVGHDPESYQSMMDIPSQPF